jgi:protoheme IX farnesyltransferase
VTKAHVAQPLLATPRTGDASHTRAGTARGVRALVETTKPRITRLVTITSAVGFVMGGLGQVWDWGTFAIFATAMLGTALSAAGANSINQWMERDRDARMERTRARPLPSARAAPSAVLAWGIALSVLGVSALWLLGPAPAVVALACILSYVLLYTPLKTRTTLATFVGAIPGALPPLIGASAALGGGLGSLRDPVGWSLVALMAVWQLPHFLAIAWLYQEDYTAGGYRVLPSVDADGRLTAAAMTLWAWALLPASLLPVLYMPERLSLVYPLLALMTGAAYLVLCVRLAITREPSHARQVFFASIVHLPLLLLAMVAEGLARQYLV